MVHLAILRQFFAFGCHTVGCDWAGRDHRWCRLADMYGDVPCRYGDSAVGPVRTLPVMRSFTFLRLIPDMMSPEYQSIWFRFMQQMQQTQDTE